MNAKYDSEVDILRINWSDSQKIEESDSISPCVILDYDVEGNVIGIEILNASCKNREFSIFIKEKSFKSLNIMSNNNNHSIYNNFFIKTAVSSNP